MCIQLYMKMLNKTLEKKNVGNVVIIKTVCSNLEQNWFYKYSTIN